MDKKLALLNMHREICVCVSIAGVGEHEVRTGRGVVIILSHNGNGIASNGHRLF